MSGWEEHLLALFDDLEQQAEGLALQERDERAADLAVSGYADVDLLSRLHATPGHPVRLAVAGVGQVRGVVARVGRDWLLVEEEDRTWAVPVAAVTWLRGAPAGAVGAAARPVTARLGLGSLLRSLAADRARVAVHLRDGAVVTGRLGRVGTDFVELAPDPDTGPAGAPGGGAAPAGTDLVPWAALAAVRTVPTTR